jgi:hypothetical protein
VGVCTVSIFLNKLPPLFSHLPQTLILILISFILIFRAHLAVVGTEDSPWRRDAIVERYLARFHRGLSFSNVYANFHCTQGVCLGRRKRKRMARRYSIPSNPRCNWKYFEKARRIPSSRVQAWIRVRRLCFVGLSRRPWPTFNFKYIVFYYPWDTWPHGGSLEK